MSIPFRYVRRKDSPLTIKMAGFCDFSGQFDASIYEIIEAPLPANAQQEAIPSLNQTLINVIKQANVANRAAFYTYFSAIESALNADDAPAARALLLGLSALPVGVETLRQTILAKLP
ncbi:MAG: hypothetical protein IPK79_11565 [Vampirovibrionales bacterium]|nr:hypothetical protein [Vampirovibrionales bacterium]